MQLKWHSVIEWLILLCGPGLLALAARLRRLAQRQDMIGNDGQRELCLAVLLIRLGRERALNRQRIAIGKAHQLGLDAFRKGEHLPPLRSVAVLGADCRRDERLARLRGALFRRVKELAGYEDGVISLDELDEAMRQAE